MFNKKNILAYFIALILAAPSASATKTEENKMVNGSGLFTNMLLQNNPPEKDISLIYEMDTEDAANKLAKAIGNTGFLKTTSTIGFMYILKEKAYQGNEDNKEYLQHSVQDVQKRINEVLDEHDSWRKTNYYVKIKDPSKQFPKNKVFGEGGKNFKQGGGLSDRIDIIIEKKASLVEKKGFFGLSKTKWSLILLTVTGAVVVAAYIGGMFDKKTNGEEAAETAEEEK